MSELRTGFSVVLEQADFLVVNKEAGIDMHDDAGVPGLVSTRVSCRRSECLPGTSLG